MPSIFFRCALHQIFGEEAFGDGNIVQATKRLKYTLNIYIKSIRINRILFEAVSKPTIGPEIKAGARFKPEEQSAILEDSNLSLNTEFGIEGRF